MTTNDVKFLVTEMDQRVKRMLKLIEEDGGSLTMSVGASQRKPELIANVEQFHQMYQLLAERYDHLTKELCNSIPSLLQVQGLGNSPSSFDQDFPLLTPDVKHGVHKSGHKIVGLDTSPSSGRTSSVLSLKRGNESSFLSSSSDSESESFSSSSNSGPPVNIDGQVMQQKIFELETELLTVKDELQTREADLELEKKRVLGLQKQVAKLETHISGADNKARMLVEELEVTKERLEGSAEGADQLQGQLEVARKDIAMLEAQLNSERMHVLELQKTIERYTADLSDSDHEVRELKLAVSDVQEKYSLEKKQLQSDILGMSKEQAHLRIRVKEWEARGKELEDRILLSEAEKVEMKRLHDAQEMTLQEEINRQKVELAERREHVEVLNKDFDRLKLNYDMLMAEKDGLSAKVQTLVANVSCRDNQIQEMERQLHQLNRRHEELAAGSESAQQLAEELKLRVEELEKEVDRQNVLIADGAEEKREVIRQLSFSLDFYRNEYQVLRAFVSHKGHAIMAS